MDNQLQEKLKSLYTDPNFIGSLGGRERFYTNAKEQIPQLTRQQVKEFLTSEDPYTIHAPARRRFKRSRIFVRDIAQLYQSDLADMTGLAHWNDETKYLLGVIDVFSKYAWVAPLKDKTSRTVANSLRALLDRVRKPEDFMTDKVRKIITYTFPITLH